MVEEPFLTGRLIFQYFYDVGGKIESERIPKEKLQIVEIPPPKKERLIAPRYGWFEFSSIVIDLGDITVGRQKARVEGRIFPIGVIGIYVIVEFRRLTFSRLIKLISLSEGRVKVGKEEKNFDDIPREFFQKLKEKISPALIPSYPPMDEPHAYLMILIADTEPRLGARDFLEEYRKQTAGVLRGEREWMTLSEKEVEDALKPYLSYSEDDIAIVDWYAALISGSVDYMDDMVRIIELALVQLLVLKTYDRLLDMKTREVVSSLSGFLGTSRLSFWITSRRYRKLLGTLGEISSFSVQVTDLVESARNITKLTGEWYLGKLYRLANERFRISDWLSLVDRKLERLREIYNTLMERVDVQRGITLELLVFILILIMVFLEILMVVG
ncbi:MAG: hypothetical protein QXU01_03210 [Candidatus Hadarchaeales archaeon]